MKPPIVLNMIVKNEAERIERCLRSVLPHVTAAVILDTGSTDKTQEIIFALGAEYQVPVFIYDGPFENFSQARNLAFSYARKDRAAHEFFALLMDADMELVVEDANAFMNLDANALGYDMMQKGGTVSYANRRLLNLSWGTDPYRGVTHEYVDVPAAGMIHGARFVDHADGFNRKDKFQRDAQLLEAALKDEPENARYWFYLGNTYRDWHGQTQDKTLLPYAMSAYQKRIAIGGWDEETHNAMMCLAACHKSIGNEDAFIGQMVKAFNFRPCRAEPLYDLAVHFREKGDMAAALLFAKRGLDIPRPNDVLFVNDFVYEHGLRYEFAIAGFYDEAERSRAAEITNALALDPTCPEFYRRSARANLYWYTKPLSQLIPTRFEKLDFVAPHGYVPMNPSIVNIDGVLTCNIRCVNYRMDEQGRYIIHNKGEVIDTRNFLVTLDPVPLSMHNPREIIWNRPAPKFDLVTGLEDIRLRGYMGALQFTATVREQSPRGICEIWSGALIDHGTVAQVGPNASCISDPERYEKNWMPIPAEPYETERFMYRLDVVRDIAGNEAKLQCKASVGDISGSSQCVFWRQGYLAVVHEAETGPDGKRTYWHRFVWFNQDMRLRRVSQPFVFFERQIEFCAGLCRDAIGEGFIISFGVRDEEAWLCRVLDEDVGMLLWEEVL